MPPRAWLEIEARTRRAVELTGGERFPALHAAWEAASGEVRARLWAALTIAVCVEARTSASLNYVPEEHLEAHKASPLWAVYVLTFTTPSGDRAVRLGRTKAAGLRTRIQDHRNAFPWATGRFEGAIVGVPLRTEADIHAALREQRRQRWPDLRGEWHGIEVAEALDALPVDSIAFKRLVRIP